MAVSRAAVMVHRKLSPIAKQITGMWALMFAVAEGGMALSAMGVTIIFSTLASKDWTSICWAIYVFQWSLLLALLWKCWRAPHSTASWCEPSLTSEQRLQVV